MDDSTDVLNDPLTVEDRQAQQRRGDPAVPFFLINSLQEEPEPAQGTGWCAPSP